jgi:predicted nucleic acid-binding Zn ribbon protein
MGIWVRVGQGCNFTSIESKMCVWATTKSRISAESNEIIQCAVGMSLGEKRVRNYMSPGRQENLG